MAGGSWRMVNAAMGGHGRDRGYMQVSALVVDPRDSQTVYATTRCAGVFRSTDGGRRWSPANAGLEPRCPWAYSLALDPRASKSIYAAGSSRGVFKSLDGGARWHAANTGLSLSTVFSLAVDPRRPRTVYAGAGGLGLFKSGDAGTHWRSLASAPELVDGVALDPSNPRNVLAVAAGYGIVRSTDAGRTWAGASFGAAARRVDVVAISGKTAYAGTFGARSLRELGRRTQLARTRRRSRRQYTFRRSQSRRETPPSSTPAGTAGNASGLYKSTDGGSSWQRLTDALDTGVDAIALDPENPATVYIGTPGGEGSVFRSTDGGTSWQPAELGAAAATGEDRHRQADHLHGRRDRSRDRSRTPRDAVRGRLRARRLQKHGRGQAAGSRSTRA